MHTGLLEAEGLRCVRGARTVFDGLSLSVAAGTLLRVEGPNGSGKTSLLRTLCGLLAPHAGEIRWQGQRTRDVGENFRAALFYLGHQHGLKEELSAAENLRYAAALRGLRLEHSAAIAALQNLGVGESVQRPVRALSQGQKRRAALAALEVHHGAALWLLDEPFVALDATAVATVSRLIETQVAAGGIVVYTTHQDVPLSASRCDVLRLA